MGRPAEGYKLEGKRVPGVTTIISRWKESGGLIHWAWQCGMDGEDYRRERDAAGATGKLVHDVIEAILRAGREIPPYHPTGPVAGAIEAFRAWTDQHRLVVKTMETPIVSVQHRYGGTIDATAEIGGKLAILDWKTSNAVYVDHLLQGAGYSILYEERYGVGAVDGGFHLLRFSKPRQPDDPISFHHHFWSDLTLAKEQFLRLREAYDVDARLAAMI